MPKYAILCSIDEARLDLFARFRAEHYAFLIQHRHRILFGGPARMAEGGRPETMIIIAEADDLSDAQRFIAQEPYNRNGGFSHVAVRPWSQVLPETEPGLLQATYEAERAKLER